MEKDTRTLRSFLTIAMAEGISFLVLLGIAMPLKYMAGIPMAVKLVGWIHGVLFVLYLYQLSRAASLEQWKTRHSLLALVAGLLPFGTFVLDKKIKKEFALNA